ncbi:single-stranded DNA-binding protein [Salmonella enterica subsp. enterica serovar Muenchen]|uniref:Single-stranded DNA-binding protein n=2 Tax=Salmonella enterica TaxID=28901 RepID=A0A735CZB6_SALMU|nr:single-stranded DNA-binding protein [Salmonella enterica]EDI8507299.1 single-stranded DNA-binding protein [Salmonella enterica subsp. enterica serovar Muenchen]EDS0467172.1 single-stranded DNA-binding protein [Salmonella enterica subsp. enterica serovar Javiana]EAS1747790.1 single-stranded DNA-binding protein [Salmonella enterica]EAS1809074.1 single-stranded DNA-binding protein [Salmonella enterica]
MDLNDLKDQLDSDVKIDATKLQWEALNNPVVYSKWLRIYSEAKREIVALEAKKKKALKDRLDFYTNRKDDAWNPIEYEKSEMKVVMAADEIIIKLDTKISYYSLIVDLAARAMDIIKGRGYAINQAIKIRELESGK